MKAKYLGQTESNIKQEGGTFMNGQDLFNAKSRIESKSAQKSILKGFLTTVTAGVIGSAFTLTAIPYLPINNQQAPEIVVSQENTREESSSSKEAEQVSAAANSLSDMIEHASQAIVGISNIRLQNNPFNRQVSEEDESGTGTGVIFKKTDDTAYIVTNNHVIEDAQEIEVSLYEGENVTATLIGTDPLTDIAVLKISGIESAPVLEFGDSSKLRAGDQVLAIGNPLGLELSRTVTQGIVSAVDRTIAVTTSAGEWDLEVIQTDAAINPGNSGGALINTSGELVGINSLKIADSGVEGLGFAIPSNEVQSIIEELIESGQVVRPYLGIGLANFEEIPQYYLQSLPESVTEGAIVINIDQNSAAAKAGLELEDILVSIEGEAISDSTNLRKYLYTEASIGEEVEIELYRKGVLMKVQVILTSNQSSNE